MKKSIAPSLNMLFQASYGDIDFILDIIKEGGQRINKKHLMILSEYKSRPGEKPITLNEVHHEFREKVYNENWKAAEKQQQIQRLAEVVQHIKNIKSVEHEQLTLLV